MSKYILFVLFVSLPPIIESVEYCGVGNLSDSVQEDCKHCRSKDYGRIDVFRLWRDFPTAFIPKHNVNKECEVETELLYKDAMDLKLWAMKMLDSSAKLPSGILNGNLNQFGDFDQCLSINRPILGKYCLATIDISFETVSDLNSLIHSHHWIASNATDPGHRVPRVSTIHWGVCLPSSCTALELQNALKNYLKTADNVIVDEKMCLTSESDTNPMSKGKLLTILFFIVLFGVVVCGTVLDRGKDESSTIRQFLIQFSLHKNVKKLLDTSATSEDVSGLDGLRAYSAMGLLLCHKSFAMFFNPYTNRTEMAEMFGKPWAVIGRTAIVYTDSFLLISGFLTARSLLKDLKMYNEMRFFKKLINRLFRLLPSLFTVILFCTYILPDLGNGPQWEMVINEHSRFCKSNMWRNLLFVHNFMGFENMCLTHTHQLAIDMQLFLMTPLAVGLLWYFRMTGVKILLLLSFLSTLLRFHIVKYKELSLVVYYGISAKKLFDTAKFSYILPSHRATIYIMGIILAYFFAHKESRIYLNKFDASLGWTIAIVSGLTALISPWHMGLLDYKYNSTEAASYGALSPIFWGIFISWFIWACNNNCAGRMGSYFSMNILKIFTRIAYGIYLTQFPIFFYNIGMQRNADYYRMHMMINIPEMCVVFAASTLLTLVVDLPFNNLYKILFNN